MTSRTSNSADSQVAIVGMAGRFPRSHDLDEWWQHLRSGTELVTFFSDDELIAAGVSPSLAADPEYVKAAAILGDERIAGFDASFFGFSPTEAALMDPQHRLFLETAYHALENAAYIPGSSQGAIGVFASQTLSSYWLRNVLPNGALVESMGSLQAALGSAYDALATRVSYKLNLTGPSITVQTACSSSLVAVHLACQSVLTGECDLAIAGGVSVAVPQQAGYRRQEGGILSPDGHCRVFDARAQGTVNGSGVGVVVLKRLTEAVDDGDFIHAVILGSAVNNDGSAKVGFTAPGGNGQRAVIADALSMAGVGPDDISYVEAHGTGTALGDPVEVAALAAAFRTASPGHRCTIGSVKSNMGHLDAAAGIAGLIKTVLQLRHREIAPSLHFETPNPKIQFSSTPFVVGDRLQEWNADSRPLRAGVSSFGMGGTNAHVVLEGSPLPAPASPSRTWHVIVNSARSEAALTQTVANFERYLRAHPDSALADVAYTTQVGRTPFLHRHAVIGCTSDEVLRTLETGSPSRTVAGRASPSRRIAFMFPGQGSQYAGMGRDLYASEPVFRDELDRCAELLRPHLNRDVREVLYGPGASDETVAQTWITQPVLFAVEYALARMWMGFGLKPDVMIGHSLGEYVAACVANVMSLENALAIVAARGRLVQRMPPGAMLAVALDECDAVTLAGGRLSLAAVNGEKLCVLSGPSSSIEEVQLALAARGVEAHRLKTSHAFHSMMMDPVLEEFDAILKSVHLGKPAIPFISNVTGTWIRDDEAASPAYWKRHLRTCVRFADGIAELQREAHIAMLEVGPGRALTTLVRRHPGFDKQQPLAASMRSATDKRSDEEVLAAAMAHVWVSGGGLAWEAVAGAGRRRLPLPGYPFERQRYWIDAPSAAVGTTTALGRQAKRLDSAEWSYVPSWTRMAPLAGRAPLKSSERSCWLIFLDEVGLGARIAGLLGDRGQQVVTVAQGTAFSCDTHDAVTIDPENRADYFRLLSHIRNRGMVPETIVHSWSLSASSHGNRRSVVSDGFLSLVFLGAALANEFAGVAVQIAALSNGLHAVTGHETLMPDKATLLGACLVIPQEYRHVVCRSIDVDLDADALSSLPAQLVTEMLAPSTGGCVAYRHGHRWVQRFEPAPLGSSAGGAKRIRRGGVYLITGGLGNIGLALCEFLSRTAPVKLAIVGRSTFPERHEWELWVRNHDADDPTTDRIRRLQRIEGSGSEVLVLAADVADRQAMHRVVRDIQDRFGDLNGVVHAAGALSESDFAYVQELDRTLAERQFRSKVDGLIVLDEMLAPMNLDFCVAMSSLSAVLGGLRFAAYSAANAFMDAFVDREARRRPGRWTSIDWDTWVFGADPVTRDAANPLPSLSAEEGIDTFQRVLDAPQLSRILISTGDLHARMTQWVYSSRPAQAAVTAVEMHPRPPLNSRYTAPRNDVDRAILQVWQHFLGIDEIGIHDNFFDLGGHSLMATQMFSRIRELLKSDLPLREFFAMSTVAELSDRIVAAEPEAGWTQRILRVREMVDGMSPEDAEKALQERT